MPTTAPRFTTGQAVVLRRDLGKGSPQVGASGLILLVDDAELTVEFSGNGRTQKLWRLRPADVTEPAKGRRRPGSTVCSKGHELSEDNLYVSPAQPRGVCRACRRAAGRKYLGWLKQRPVVPKVLP